MLICGRNAYTALPIAIIAIKIEKTDEKISSRMTNILSWIAAALLGAASAVVLALDFSRVSCQPADMQLDRVTAF
jgi:hypothetical protein